MSLRPIILLVDDSEDDTILVRRAFVRAKLLNPLVAVASGEEAIAYLGGTDKYANRAEFPLPGLVLLDLKMPGSDGFEVLRWIRTQPCLHSLRVVVLTASDEVRDVKLAYQLGATSYLVKPLDFERLVEISQALSGCWVWLDKGEPQNRPIAARI
jgi:CheY-like chemotaxis protein